MVTPYIHWCIHLDLVTGSPENVDDDDIQCLGKMLLDSLEPTMKYNPLGSFLRCCWIAWSVVKSLQFSLLDHTLAALLKSFAEQKSSRCEDLKGWSWLPFHRCSHCA